MSVGEAGDGALMTVDAVSFDYGDEPVLDEVSFSIEEGENTAIVGVSGRGKSTLLRLMAGLEDPREGHVSWKGSELRSPTREIGIVFQNFEETIFDWLTVRENVELAVRADGFGESEGYEVDQIAERLGIAEKLDSKGESLSGGQEQRVAIARTLAQGADLILLDEPFSNLDTMRREHLIEILDDIGDEFGTTICIVSHDIEEALMATSRVFCLLRPEAEEQLYTLDWTAESDSEDPEVAEIYTLVRSRAERIIDILEADMIDAGGREEAQDE